MGIFIQYLMSSLPMIGHREACFIARQLQVDGLVGPIFMIATPDRVGHLYY